MSYFYNLLSGGDLRSIGKSNQVVSLICSQKSFDTLFQLLFQRDRKIVMRAADAIEKISLAHPHYLGLHKKELLKLFDAAEAKELKWHLALLVSRLPLLNVELENVRKTLVFWATNKKESKIVRVNALQGLYNLSKEYKQLEIDFDLAVSKIEDEPIPSLQARIRKLKEAKKNG